MPAGSLPPAHWAGMPGRQGVEKIHPAINFTMHSKVRAVVAHGLASFLFFFFHLLCSFRSLMLRRRIPFLSGFSIYRVASGYLPNPRLRCRHHHLKFPLRLLLKRPRPPPRWRRPRLGELFTLSRARGVVSYTCARNGFGPLVVLKRKVKETEKKRSVLSPPFWFVEMIR
jgi:hypothetical protein